MHRVMLLRGWSGLRRQVFAVEFSQSQMDFLPLSLCDLRQFFEYFGFAYGHDISTLIDCKHLEKEGATHFLDRLRLLE